MNMISILVPTWGRPARLRDMVRSVLATAAEPDELQILVRVSEADPELAEYRRQWYGYPAQMYCVAGADTYAQGIEWLQRRAVGAILFAGADDVLFRTPNWDAAVRAAFAGMADGLQVAYANNGLDREKCEHFFTTRRWIDAVGYMVPSGFRHFCVDQWVEELARGLGRLQFLREVTVEHMHKKYAKAPDDDTYRRVRGATRTSERDNEIYAGRAAERAAALARLRSHILTEGEA